MEKGMKEIHVIKREGERTPLNLDKIHVMVEHACNGLAGVSESQVEMNANLQFFDGIKTSDIQEILIRSANDLISLEAPNYQFVAARLLLFSLRKAVYNGHPDGHPPLKEHVEKCVSLLS
jgi:ribonucleoside-diphosphate reductase alpha chain